MINAVFKHQKAADEVRAFAAKKKVFSSL